MPAVLDGRFEIERLAGAGAMGAVYKARDRVTGELVAVKVLRVAHPDAAMRFAREAELLASLDHPAIVRSVATGATPRGEPFLAMEWLEGEDLSARLARERLSISEALTVATRVAEALGAAHARGVVHRDVKPSNLFLVGGELERVRLLDFGIAKLTLGESRATQTGALIGTPGYFAPEQAEGGRVEPASDVFALGCVLFECLTGQPPYGEVGGMVGLTRLLLEAPPRLETAMDAPAELSDLLARMMSRAASARPVDGAAVARELGALSALHLTHGAARAGIGAHEARTLSVILAMGTSEFDELSGATDDTITEMPPPLDPLLLRSTVRAHAGSLTELGDGATVITFYGGGAHAEPFFRAARCAIALRSVVPSGAMTLATGRGAMRGGMPSGTVMDRAQGALHALASTRDSSDEIDVPSAPSAIRLDALSATLLATRFQVARDAAGATLGRELAATEAPANEPPFVGRSRELATLLSLAHDVASERHAGVASILGPPGSGKTRLLRALLHALSTSELGFATLVARNESTSGEPLSALTRSTGEHDAAAIAAHVRALVAKGPTLLAVDDLERIDRASSALIDQLLTEHADAPLLVLAFGRPEAARVLPKRWVEHGVQSLRLANLSRAAGLELARAVLGERMDSAPIEALVARAAGNPFALLRLCEADGDAVPESAIAVLEARLAALDSDARRTLRAASIFGEHAPLEGVRAVLDASSAELASWRAELTKADVLMRPGRGEGDAIVVAPLVREAAYATMLPEDRDRGHRLAASWLEQTSGDDEAIGRHFALAGDAERAIEAYRRGAALARARGDEPAARACERHARELDSDDEAALGD
jgi:hypothetical protein